MMPFPYKKGIILSKKYIKYENEEDQTILQIRLDIKLAVPETQKPVET